MSFSFVGVPLVWRRVPGTLCNQGGIHMYLFSRNVRLGAGNPEKQLAWALKMTEGVFKG